MTFFKSFLASCLGIFTSFALLLIAFFIVIASSTSEPLPVVKQNTVLTIEMSGTIPAYAIPSPVESYFNPNAANKVSLVNLKDNLEKAAADDRIKGVWVKANLLSESWANLQHAYSYFEKFKESGKFLYFSTDDIGMNEQTYYLASLADSVFSPPNTNFEFDGFIYRMSFYADMLDKIGVEPEIFRVGKYKSAVEPFLQTSASPESREQMEQIMAMATETFIEAVSERTGKSMNEVNEMLNSSPTNRLQFAHENGLIDTLAFESDIERIIKTKLNLEEQDEIKTINFQSYGKIPASTVGIDLPSSQDRVAVIYTDGAIMPELGNESPLGNSGLITASNVQEQLDEALDRSTVKAIVVHINSPGGSASTSDLIWNSIREASKEKPVIAYMGAVAASGGYYMAMGADSVMAGPNTITGSIGIFNLLFNMQELTEDKIGLDFDVIKSHEYADLLNLTDPFTPAEERIIQQNVENGYEVFLDRVAANRGMTRDEVHEVAQGRVWTGADAWEVGLVDELGSLEDAIGMAAEMAEIKEYRIENYPKQKGLFEALMASSQAKVQNYLYSWLPFEKTEEVKTIRMLMEQPSGQNWMILPTEITIK